MPLTGPLARAHAGILVCAQAQRIQHRYHHQRQDRGKRETEDDRNRHGAPELARRAADQPFKIP